MDSNLTRWILGITPKTEIEKVKNEIKDITLKEASLKEILEKENIEKQNLDTQKTSEENKSEMLLKMLAEGEEKLNVSLNENSFETSEIAFSIFNSKRRLNTNRKRNKTI